MYKLRYRKHSEFPSSQVRTRQIRNPHHHIQKGWTSQPGSNRDKNKHTHPPPSLQHNFRRNVRFQSPSRRTAVEKNKIKIIRRRFAGKAADSHSRGNLPAAHPRTHDRPLFFILKIFLLRKVASVISSPCAERPPSRPLPNPARKRQTALLSTQSTAAMAARTAIVAPKSRQRHDASPKNKYLSSASKAAKRPPVSASPSPCIHVCTQHLCSVKQGLS